MPARRTRQSKQATPPLDNSQDETSSEAIQDLVINLQQENQQTNRRLDDLTTQLELITQALRALSATHPNPIRIIPSTEVPPQDQPPEPLPIDRATTPLRYEVESSADSLRSPHTRISKKILELDDGQKPTFRQWKISIQDRLTRHADHYPTEQDRKGLIWESCEGRAQGYLETRYMSEDSDFTTAQEMVDLLSSYYLTGLEDQVYRNEFKDLTMGDQNPRETFVEFAGRF